jgi:hypothetical protein
MPTPINFNRHIMFSDTAGHSIEFDKSFDFFKKWDEYTLTVDSDKGPLTLKWNNVQALAANWFVQTGSLTGQPMLQNFFEFFPMWVKWNWWNLSERGVYDLPNNPTIIDIGAGNSVLDLLLSQYNTTSKFILIDRNEFINQSNIPKYPSPDSICWQHSWSIVTDAIQTTSIDSDRFNFIDIEDPWNVEADLITSHMAWCMHFPKHVYWDKMLSSLKIGGRLVLDINIDWEQEYLEEISEALGCRHTVITSFPNKPFVNNLVPVNKPIRDKLNICGYRCSWIRHK